MACFAFAACSLWSFSLGATETSSVSGGAFFVSRTEGTLTVYQPFTMTYFIADPVERSRYEGGSIRPQNLSFVGGSYNLGIQLIAGSPRFAGSVVLQYPGAEVIFDLPVSNTNGLIQASSLRQSFNLMPKITRTKTQSGARTITQACEVLDECTDASYRWGRTCSYKEGQQVAQVHDETDLELIDLQFIDPSGRQMALYHGQVTGKPETVVDSTGQCQVNFPGYGHRPRMSR